MAKEHCIRLTAMVKRNINGLCAVGTIIDSKPEPPATFTKPRTMSASSGKTQPKIDTFSCMSKITYTVFFSPCRHKTSNSPKCVST